MVRIKNGLVLLLLVECVLGCASKDHDNITETDAGLSLICAEGCAQEIEEICIPNATTTSDLEVDLADLLCEMVDISRLARLPTQRYSTGLASSYNRESVSPDEPGWHANQDRGHYVRLDGDENVMLEAEGPGVVTRIWSANPSGMLRIYIDGQQLPVIETEMADILGGNSFIPFGEPLSFVAAKGHNLYFPIAFQKGCRITSTATEALYYQINYRLYEKETLVESFSRDAMIDHQQVIEKVAYILSNPRSCLCRSGHESFTLNVSNLQSDSYQINSKTGPRIIRELQIKIDDVSENLLRETVLTISFDGNKTVNVPLGDFFGSGPGLNELESLPSIVERDGLLVSRWPMPFQETALIEVNGTGQSKEQLLFTVVHEAASWDNHSLYFNAHWTGPYELLTEEAVDWNLVEIEGQGWLVGTMLNVTNSSEAWWGEGDERIYVDHEAFPSHFGTGTEDYFGFAWCCTQVFSTAYIGQTRADGPKNWGRMSLYRWNILEPILFERNLKFDFEVLHWNQGDEAVQLALDALVYWYARPGSNVVSDPSQLSEFVIPQINGESDSTEMGVYSCGG
ncbi:MAG: DUF2961 domain-containing protein [Proteobacteria bacterium]|nr:DUF2961 domain-containing protein [Pseudomonadota bacterium]